MHSFLRHDAPYCTQEYRTVSTFMWHLKAILILLWWSRTKPAVSPRSACGKPIANEQKIQFYHAREDCSARQKEWTTDTHYNTMKTLCWANEGRQHTLQLCSYKTLRWSTSSLKIKTRLLVAWARGSDDWQRRGTRELLEMQETFHILILLVVTQVTIGMSKLIRIYMHTTVPKLNLNKTY